MKRPRACLVVAAALGLALVASNALWYARRTPDASRFWAERHLAAQRDLYERLPLPPGAIVLLGDSLTERAPWRELLRRDDVYGRGIGGDTVAGVTARLGSVLRARPRAVALMIGINDLDAGRAPEEVAGATDALLVALREGSPETQVVVLSVLPMRDVGRGLSVPADRVDALNRALATRCAERGVRFVDLRPEMVDAQGQLAAEVTLDGVHLNGDGYARWAAALARELPAPRAG